MNFEPLSKRPMRVLERPTDVECLSKNPARTTPGYADESYSKEFSLSSVFYASFLDHMYRRRNEQVMAKPTNLNFMSTPISNCRNSILFIRLPSIVLGLPPLNPCPHFVKPIKLLPKSELPPGQYHHAASHLVSLLLPPSPPRLGGLRAWPVSIGPQEFYKHIKPFVPTIARKSYLLYSIKGLIRYANNWVLTIFPQIRKPSFCELTWLMLASQKSVSSTPRTVMLLITPAPHIQDQTWWYIISITSTDRTMQRPNPKQNPEFTGCSSKLPWNTTLVGTLSLTVFVRRTATQYIGLWHSLDATIGPLVQKDCTVIFICDSSGAKRTKVVPW